MSIGLNMILNDVRPGNHCSLSCGFVLVAAMTEMKLQGKCICAEQRQAFPLPLVRALVLFFPDVKQPKPSSKLGWMRNSCLTKNKKKGDAGVGGI